MHAYVSIRQISRNGIAGSKSRCTWYLDRYHENAIQKGYASLSSYKEHVSVSICFKSLSIWWWNVVKCCYFTIHCFNHEWALALIMYLLTICFSFSLTSFCDWVFILQIISKKRCTCFWVSYFKSLKNLKLIIKIRTIWVPGSCK